MANKSTIGLYTKAIASLVVTGLTSYSTAAADGNVTGSEWLTTAIAVIAGTAIVWAIPQAPEWLRYYGKSVAAGLVAFLGSLIIGLQDGGGLSQAEITTAIAALIIGSGLVGIASNAASSDPVSVATKKIIPVSLDDKRAFTADTEI
jgi:hypothetical protein